MMHEIEIDFLFWIDLCRVGIKLPTVEVRYKNLCVEAECEVVYGKPLPTIWNSIESMIPVSLLKLCFTEFKCSKYLENFIDTMLQRSIST